MSVLGVDVLVLCSPQDFLLVLGPRGSGFAVIFFGICSRSSSLSFLDLDLISHFS